ncbi:MAG: hypothetical protein J5857_09550 [Treponema sp.]|nr:hypothetical protein [Treponema sp.]
MNTIPLIFNQRAISRTVLGGTENESHVLMPVSCIILNRSGNQYRNMVFDSLEGHGFEKIICIESNDSNKSMDELSLQFPTVKFVIPHEEVTPGDMLNLGIAECPSPYALVVQDDLCTQDFQFTVNLAQKLVEKNSFCVCPRLFSSTLQVLPVNFIPNVKKSEFTVDSSLSMATGTKTFYASDWAGFYNKEKFMELGGADYTITSSYWQKLDLFFRSWLWGENTCIDTAFSLTYSDSLPEENQTIDRSYLRFYMKNILPVFRTDHAEIPASSFFAFKSRSSCSLRDAISLFGDARNWTSKNMYRFKMDAVQLIQDWEKLGD